MILLLPGFALFLLLAAPGGPMSMLRPRVIGLAARAGRAVRAAVRLEHQRGSCSDYPERDLDRRTCRTFWFDVTKADWRANMVYGIPWSTLPDRFAMYWFDLRQQFGIPGIVGGRRRLRLAALAPLASRR